MKRFSLLAALLVALCLPLHAAAEDSVYQLPVQLTDQANRVSGLDVFRGQPVLVSMFYASCPNACPTLIDHYLRLSALAPHRVYKLMTSTGRGVSGVINRAGVAVLRNGELISDPVNGNACHPRVVRASTRARVSIPSRLAYGATPPPGAGAPPPALAGSGSSPAERGALPRP